MEDRAAPVQVDAQAPAPLPLGTRLIRGFVTPLASLRLTVVLLALGIFLIFAGTLAQIDQGIWTVVGTYFRTLFVRIPFRIFFPRTMDVPGAILFPGGWLIGGVLLVNLIAAHVTRFKLTRARAGILLTHTGVILLLVGELVTGLFAAEGNMTIDQGGSSCYVEHVRQAELAIVDPADAAMDEVTSIPQSLLRSRGRIRHLVLPFDLEVARFMSNSRLQDVSHAAGTANVATAGAGMDSIAVERPDVSGTDPEQTIDLASAYVTLFEKGTDHTLGTYLFSLWLGPEAVRVGDKLYLISLRHLREYKPYTLHLIEFRHDKYLGTEIPKNFSSRVRLDDPENHVDREVLISMNNPLRYRGETFFQASFKPDDSATVLQVVRNPGWQIPYISCALVAVGLLLHFGIRLIGFLRKRSA